MTGKWNAFVVREKNRYADDHMPGRQECIILVCFSLIAMLICYAIFAAIPDLDLFFTDYFYVEGKFLLQSDGLIVFARNLILWLLVVFYGVVLICGMLAFKRQRNVMGFVWHNWAFVGAGGLLGPVFLVNGLLKSHWDRARPSDVAEFGGEWNFTQFWELGLQCEQNCSFASGEVSGIAMIFISFAFILSNSKRWFLIVSGLVVTMFSVWLRIATGAHFLSDTMMAVPLMVMVATLAYALFYMVDHDWFGRLDNEGSENIQKRSISA